MWHREEKGSLIGRAQAWVWSTREWQDVCMLSRFSCVRVFATLWTIACQGPLSMEFSRQEYWSGLPCPPPGDLPDPGIWHVSLMSPALSGGFFTTSATWEVQQQDDMSIVGKVDKIKINWRPASKFKALWKLCPRGWALETEWAKIPALLLSARIWLLLQVR